MTLKALEDRITELEKFIAEQLDQLIDQKILNSEKYLEEKINEVSESLGDEIDDVRSDIPDTYDLESDIENVRDDLSDRINQLESRVGDLE